MKGQVNQRGYIVCVGIYENERRGIFRMIVEGTIKAYGFICHANPGSIGCIFSYIYALASIENIMLHRHTHTPWARAELIAAASLASPLRDLLTLGTEAWNKRKPLWNLIVNCYDGHLQSVAQKEENSTRSTAFLIILSPTVSHQVRLFIHHHQTRLYIRRSRDFSNRRTCFVCFLFFQKKEDLFEREKKMMNSTSYIPPSVAFTGIVRGNCPCVCVQLDNLFNYPNSFFFFRYFTAVIHHLCEKLLENRKEDKRIIYFSSKR